MKQSELIPYSAASETGATGKDLNIAELNVLLPTIGRIAGEPWGDGSFLFWSVFLKAVARPSSVAGIRRHPEPTRGTSRADSQQLRSPSPSAPLEIPEELSRRTGSIAA